MILNTSVDTVTLLYGDAKISFFNILLGDFRNITGTEHDSVPHWHTHSYYEIHFATYGNFEITFKDRTVTLPKNMMMIIPPQTPHVSVCAADGSSHTTTVLSVSVSQNASREKFYDCLISSLDGNALVPIDIPSSMPSTLDCFCDGKLYRSVVGTSKLRLVASGVIFSIVSTLYVGDASSELPDKEIRVIIDNMIACRSFSLEDIANATNYSKRHISRLIKQIYGRSLSEIRNEMNEKASK